MIQACAWIIQTIKNEQIQITDKILYKINKTTHLEINLKALDPPGGRMREGTTVAAEKSTLDYGNETEKIETNEEKFL